MSRSSKSSPEVQERAVRMDFVDQCRDRFGVEPIRKILPIAPSTYYEGKARQADPGRLSPSRQSSDAHLENGKFIPSPRLA